MKNKNLIGIYCILVLLIAPTVLVGVKDGVPGVAELSERLQLNEQQISHVNKVFKMADSQAEKDRENYKGNPIALIEAAKRRRAMTDQHIESVLNDHQKQEYSNLKQFRGQNDELFILQEGLMLTKEQFSRIKTIVDNHHKMLESRRGGMRRGRGGPGMRNGGMVGGMSSGGMGGGMGRGVGRGVGPMGRGGAESMHDRMLQNMKDMDAKKAKKIKKVLTKEQKVMYKEIRKMQKKEMEQRFQKRMEHMQQSRN
jgi:hypothetical protein